MDPDANDDGAELTRACIAVGVGGSDPSLDDDVDRLSLRATKSQATHALAELLRFASLARTRNQSNASVLQAVVRTLAGRSSVCTALDSSALREVERHGHLHQLRRLQPETFAVLRDEVFKETDIEACRGDDGPRTDLPSWLLDSLAYLTTVERWAVLRVLEAERDA